MKKHSATLFLLLAAGAAGAAMLGDPAATGLQQRHAQMQQLHDSMHGVAEAGRGRALAARFRDLYPDAEDTDALRASDDASLHLRFDDATLANFYRNDAYAFAAAHAAFAELERRRAATAGELARMRNALLAARRFEDATRLGEAHPEAGFAPLPRFVDAGDIPPETPSAWREAGDGRLERVAVDLGPTQVFVEAGCHFSDDAAREIAADPVLGPVFRAHATWLGLPPGAEDPVDVAEWDRTHPEAPMLMLHDRDAWPMFPAWRMPTFHVVRDGKVVGTVIGWKPAGARDELVALLRANDLLPKAPQR